jgi:deazaflavin-dependent oxidoreductase (nitroreductase family)
MQVGADELSWNARIILDLRENGGRSTIPPFIDSTLLVLTTRGATTGELRTCPLGVSRDGDRYVVVGSNSGGPLNPVWLRNVLADPDVTVEIGGETFSARAIVTEGAERRRLLDRHEVVIPIFAKYEQMAGRELPVVVLERSVPG